MLTLPDQYPKPLAELARMIYDRLVWRMDEAAAESLAMDLVGAIQQRYAGEQVYIPKGDAFVAHQRNARIWREFSGRNYRELARTYGLTIKTTYKVVATERAKRQATLRFD